MEKQALLPGIHPPKPKTYCVEVETHTHTLRYVFCGWSFKSFSLLYHRLLVHLKQYQYNYNMAFLKIPKADLHVANPGKSKFLVFF